MSLIKIKCPICEGKGKRECTMCYGYGDWITHGSLFQASGSRRCSWCKGRGEEQCDACKGKKEITKEALEDYKLWKLADSIADSNFRKRKKEIFDEELKKFKDIPFWKKWFGFCLPPIYDYYKSNPNWYSDTLAEFEKLKEEKKK